MVDEARQRVPAGPSAFEVFERFVESRDSSPPPAPDAFLRLLKDEDSQREFEELVQAYSWTEEKLPRNIFANVVLADRFRLVEKLGAGGMGQVWRAHDAKLDREVAVKVLNLLTAGSLDVDSGFARETRLLAQLNHPGIVGVLDSHRDENHRFLVMELVRGTSLEEVIQGLIARAGEKGGSRRLGARAVLELVAGDVEPGAEPLLDSENHYESVAKVMASVLRTLEAAHGQQIVHRDLKPANIMLTGGGSPVLLDFGLGGFLNESPGDLTSGLFGTMRFIAPEQFAQETVGADVRTDVYQVGLVLYEFLTLSKCFPMEETFELIKAISHGQFEQPRAIDGHVPRALEDVCLRAIELDPGRRYQTATEFREDLERFLAGEPVRAGRYGRLGSLARDTRYRVRRHGKVLLAVAAVVLVGLLVWVAASLYHADVQILERKFTGENYGFAVDVPEVRHVVAFFKVKKSGPEGETMIVPARLRTADGVVADADVGVELGDAGKHELQAVRPDLDFDHETPLEVSVLVARSLPRLKKVRQAMADLLQIMKNNDASAVGLKRATQLLNQASKSADPAERMTVDASTVYGDAAWRSADGAIEAVTLKWRSE